MKKLAALIIGLALMASLVVLTLCGMKPLTTEEMGLYTDSDMMELYIETEYGSEYNGELCEECCDDENLVFYLYDENGMMEAICAVDKAYFTYFVE